MASKGKKYELPEGYAYLFDPDNENTFRIKEISSPTQVEAWLRSYEQLTKTTWRKAATYPYSGKINIFRVDLRCVHATDTRVKGIRPSKNTNCPARLNLIIRRFVPHSKAKHKDSLLPDWPCIVVFKNSHNHSRSGAALKYRDMSSETSEKLLSLFREGYNPSSALKQLKSDLSHEHPDDYPEMENDTYYVPTISVVYKLFKKASTLESSSPAEDTVFELKSEIEIEKHTINASELLITPATPQLSRKEEKSFKNLIARITAGIEDQPSTYVPAVKKMLHNVSKYATTETGLVTALHTFAKYKGKLPLVKKRKRSSAISVPTTTSGRRKHCSNNKKILSPRHSKEGEIKMDISLEDHHYTNFNLSVKQETPL